MPFKKLELKNALPFLFSFLSLLSSCAAPSGDLPRFSAVEQGKAYRSAQPNESGFQIMAKAGIKTVIKLNTEFSDQEPLWAKRNGIVLISIPLPGIGAPGRADEDRIQALISDPSIPPVLFHCKQGQDRTGLVAAIYRVKVQGWTPTAAHKEWLDLGHSPFLFLMDQYFEKAVK